MSTTTPPRPTGLELTSDQLELQRRAREFVENVLMPLELEAEERGGELPEATVEDIKREAIAARLNGGRFAPEYGGQGWSMLEWFLVNEQFGRVTNGLHWHVPNAYNVLMQGTPEQIERYLLPALRGEGGDAYAVTEAEAGSDPGGIAIDCGRRRTAGWRINGEKWFVTSGDVARVLIVMANVVDGADRLPTLFLIEPGAQGVEYVDNPKFTHNYPHGHPTIRFTDVEVGADAAIGGDRRGRGAAARVVHRGAARDRHARARRDVAAARRDDRLGASPRRRAACGSWTTRGSRSRSPTRRPTHAVGRLLASQVAGMIDAGADLKLIHAKASMAKLFVSEAAGRCADRAVQAFGGRGYMRSQRRRAVPARAAGRPDLGGDQRGSATDHRPRARAPRGRGDDPLTGRGRGARLSARAGCCARARSRSSAPPTATASYGAQALMSLDAVGYPGEVWGVNPRPRRGARPAVRAVGRRPARGRSTRSSWRSRRRAVPDAIEQAGARGCGGAVVFSAGFAEVPDGVALQAQLVDGGAAATAARCAGPTATGSSRTHARTCAVGRRADAARARRGGADLPERQRRGQRARRRAAGCGFTRSSPAATRRCSSPPTTSSCWPARTACGRSRCISRTTAARGCARGWPRARRRRRGRGAQGRELCGRGARCRRAQRRACGRPADLPRA